MTEKDATYDFSTSRLPLPQWWGDPNRKFGYFSGDGREYVITTAETPRPWLNYLGNDEYGLVFGNHGEGFSWFRSMTARITRYTTTEYVPRSPDSGRGLYITDASGKVTANFCRPGPGYRCIHGLGYSRIENLLDGLAVNWLIWVPQSDPVEIWKVSIENKSGKKVSLNLTSALEWHLGQYIYSPPCRYESTSDMGTDIVSRYDKQCNCIIAENTGRQVLRYSAFFKPLSQISRYDCNCDHFIGDSAYQVSAFDLLNSDAVNKPAAALFKIPIVLEKGQQGEFYFVGGVWQDKPHLDRLLAKYTEPSACEKSFSDLKSCWNKIINDTVSVNTPNKEVNLWCNVRLKHLNHITKRWTRGLDRGFRDILQDLRGFILFDPASVKYYLKKTLEYQYSCGKAVRQWSEVGANDDKRDYSDSPVWIADVLTAYIKETGDYGLINEEVKFYDSGSASIYEHLMRGIWHLFESRGTDGLCLIRHGDWNDALEGIGKAGRAQGVWLSIALYWAMGLCRDLCNAIGDNANVLKIFEAMDVLKAAINEYGWTGKWYSYAIDDNGVKIGAPENPEGQLHLNPQTFAIFSGIAGPEHSAQCFEAVDKLMTEIGPLLVTPSYKNFKAGRIWRMEPGTFENGSMYFHGAAFKMMADLAAAKPDRALDTFLKILPSNPLNPPARSTIEPYALGNYYCGRENRYFGLNIFSHFTGSYPWLSKALVETMVGVRAEYDGLLIEPMLPSGWNQVNVKRKYRGRMYEINIARSPLPGTYDISLDGKLIAQGVSRIIAVKADRCEL